MELKWIGAALVVAGGGGVGALMALQIRRECTVLGQLLAALRYMVCELEYRRTPLPELCRQASQQCRGCISGFLRLLAQELEDQIAPDAACCARAALGRSAPMPRSAMDLLQELGGTLGTFDVVGQVKGLEAAQGKAQRKLEELEKNREQRVRSYQTLGLCAGAALAILLL